MKVIIPVAGVGTRLRPHTHTVPKVLINVAGKPILGHILDSLVPFVDELVLIIGYMSEKVKRYVDMNYNFKVTYAKQKERKGLGHAIYLAKSKIETDSFLIMLGDTVFEVDLNSVLKNKYTTIGVKEVPDPKRFGIVETKNGRVVKLVEKPSNPKSNLAVAGIYYIKNSRLLFNCIEEIMNKDIRTKGEYQLTDALQLMIENGETIKTFQVDGWYDCGKPETLLLTNRHLLTKFSKKASVKGSILVDPVYISPSATVKNSIIGPYVSIADGAKIKSSIIQDTIINENSQVMNALVFKSIIGSYAVVRGRFKKLNVGDSSEIIIE